ncbi:MAG: phosphotransferase [Prevotella sp.]|nr:phosphotransferase [Prevotella sp.]
MMNAKTVNLQEWEAFGGGGFGTSYYNKADDSVVLKLNKPVISEDKAREEFLHSKAVYDMGIPSAEPYEFVTDGERYGMIVQRIYGKESFGRIIADHPERLEELAAITADYSKALHAIPCNTDVFDSVSLRTRNLIAACENLPDDVKTRLIGYIDEMEPATTCLHGDINPCNIIIAAGKVYWIDLGDFGYGDPLLDWSILAHMSELGPNPFLRHIFHIDRKTLRLFYDAMGRHYFGSSWDTPETREKMNRASQIMAGKAICLWPVAAHINLPFLQGKKLKTALNLFIGDHIKVK